MELTVPFEMSIDDTYNRKMDRYGSLVADLQTTEGVNSFELKLGLGGSLPCVCRSTIFAEDIVPFIYLGSISFIFSVIF